MAIKAGAVVVLVAMGVVGCGSAEPVSEPEEAEGQVVGVQDFAAMETELRLVKDQKDAEGRYKRSEAKLKAGPCYKLTKGGAHGAEYEIRRYTEGAAIFKKQTNKPGEGDDRHVNCLDIDDGNETRFVDVGTLDAMVRYHLGRETGLEGAAGHEFYVFERGAIGVQTAPPQAPDTLDNPRFRGRTLSQFIVGSNQDHIVPAEVTNLVFGLAWRDALVDDTFTLKNDTVGKFISVEADFDHESDPAVTTVHYQRVDVVYTRDFASSPGTLGKESIRISPKGSAGTALVSCERGLDFDVAPVGKYACTWR